jgi:hypothetical protein
VKVAAVLPTRPGGPFERSLRALTKTLLHGREDIQEAMQALIALPEVPFGKTASIVPGIRGYLVLKYRVPSRDLQRGRSGAIRVLLVHVGKQQWKPVVAYVKTEIGNLPRSDILRAIREEVP